MFTLCGRNFELIRVGLVRAGCPQELSNSVGNRGPVGFPIVVIKNRDKLGLVASTGYYPQGVVVAGVRTRAAMLNHGLTKGWAYVEAGALDINADDAIGCEELMQKLSALLMAKFYGANQPLSMQPCPYIVECYPFENYLIFEMKGQKYRQAFALDPIERKVTLQGPQQPVKEKFVDALGESMPRADTGVRYAWAPVKGNNQSFTTGGRNSELVTGLIRSLANIHEAVEMYLNYVRLSGASHWQTPTPSTAHKVALTPEHKLLETVGIAAGVFARWAAGGLAEARTSGTNTVGTGEKVHHSDFAYVGDKKDPSTWKLPIHDAKHAANALARVNQTQGIPESAKPGVLKKIRRAATKHGVAVSEPTTKQKHWAKHGGKVAAAFGW